MNLTCDSHDCDKSNTFFRVGNEWCIRYQGQAVRLPHCEGFLLVAHLLRAGAGQEVSSLDLGLETHDTENTRADAMAKIVQSLGLEAPLVDGVLGQELCDEKTFRNVKEELEHLKLEVEHARASHQVELAERLTDIIVKIEKYLADVGTLCRPRCFPVEAERARKRVANAIRRAIGAISQLHPTLASHFKASLHLGGSCSYCPTEMTAWVV